MTPRQRAARVYDREPCARAFLSDLALHRRYGVVIETPTVFVMGRAVDRYADEQALLNPRVQFSAPNAWLVWLCAGDITEAMRLMPHPLPWLGWERSNKLRWYRVGRLIRS